MIFLQISEIFNGVPQEYILGPLLFLLPVENLVISCNKAVPVTFGCKIIIHAFNYL